MMILSSAKISEKHRTRLRDRYSDETFIFCNHMDEAKHYISDADVLLTYGDDLNADLISKTSRLKWIMVLSAGIEKMPAKAISKRGILVTNARGIHKYPMAEYAISMLFQVYRQSKRLTANEKAKKWDKSVRMREINGRTMLIAGAGSIGQEVARLAKAFQMTVYGVSKSGKSLEYFDQVVKQDAIDQLLPKADFVISVLPGTPETKDFFTYDHFRKMPDHAVFLNMGRGDAVRGEVILKAVRSEEMAHAVLDVFEEEPLPEDHPFWEEERVTVTPHLSGVSPHYQTRALEIFEQNLQTYLNGGTNYVNKIDVTRGY
ncbi:D-2-hydroxyacid dehydrogenase [Lentibacillus salicampi]|uniref:D-2-hydroxyacid dehydrogenase n=1 Tax=Lentibacillus salicampi TaxID=175306 RepID=A0A4Y9A6Y2_9BACI|nr:D-2-hydroxyacid dehydrogenase [Lentibacillus salicampi]TFJ91468.1 D-2-hydroxyacid dehydrogenase [Lentibacillus salicampi]